MKLVGEVTCGDAYRCESGGDDGAVFISGIDLLDALAAAGLDRGQALLVVLDKEPIASGSVKLEAGWGYSEYTPMEPDRFEVGGYDVIERLQQLQGKIVELVVEAEPQP